MKIAVFSDTHLCSQEMIEIVGLLKPDAVIHLGDEVRDAIALRQTYPNQVIINVAGNSLHDMMSGEKRTIYMEFEGVKFMMTHGHDYSVKYGYSMLAEAARKNGAEVALFGHTHMDFDGVVDGVRCINPGSMMYKSSGDRTYAMLNVQDGSVKCEIMRIKKPW